MPEFSPGLEGVVAARTAISMVDGQNGRLIYRGYLIQDLCRVAGFEEVAHLLWYGDLPTQEELGALQAKLAKNRSLNPAAEHALRSLPREAEPMDMLRTVISAQGAGSGSRAPDVEQALAISAVFPTVVAAIYRARLGQEPVAPRPDLGQAANCLFMMQGAEAPAERVGWMDTYLVLLADHGMNASTFTARVIASTNSDLCSAVVGAIGALKGPAHGGAATGAMGMLEKIGSPENAEPWMRAALDRKEKLMGFGHRIYRTDDPRAQILRELTRTANPEFHRLASVTEAAALRLLRERHPERPQATNVDYYSAGLLQAAGFPNDFFTLAFAVSRVVGWTAHILEQTALGRLIRPESEYVGPALRQPVRLPERKKSPATRS